MMKFVMGAHVKRLRKLADAGDINAIQALVMLEQMDSISDIVRSLDNLRSDLSFVKRIADEQIENNRFLAHVRAQQFQQMLDKGEVPNDAT